MTPSAKECSPFDKECHIKVKRLMSYKPGKKTKKNKPALPHVVEEGDEAESSDMVYKNGDEKVAFDQKKMAGGPSGDNMPGESQYVRRGSREFVNVDPNLITKFNIKKKQGVKKSGASFY